MAQEEFKMRDKTCLLIIILLFFIVSPVFIVSPAYSQESTYILPYPPVMPGNILYKVRLIGENVNKYWQFGNISQFKYNLELSDKYLVQTKILFEYNQYLLGYESLIKSDMYFKQAKYFLERAEIENKQVNEKKITLQNAAQKHKEVLKKIETEVPDEFEWKPERSTTTLLRLHDTIENSQKIRKIYE